MATLDQQNTTQDSLNGLSAVSSFSYNAQGFTVSTDGLVSQIDFYLKRSGTGGGNYSVEIWSDDGAGKPNVKISGTATLIVTFVGTAAFEWIPVTIVSPPNLASGTVGHLVVYRSTDVTNYVSTGFSSGSDYSGGLWHSSADGSTWADVGAANDMDFKEYYDPVPAVNLASKTSISIRF